MASTKAVSRPTQLQFSQMGPTKSLTSPVASTPSSSPHLDSPSLILPYLYVGDQAQTHVDTISSLDISYVLSLQSLPEFLSSSQPSQLPSINSSKDYLVKIKSSKSLSTGTGSRAIEKERRPNGSSTPKYASDSTKKSRNKHNNEPKNNVHPDRPGSSLCITPLSRNSASSRRQTAYRLIKGKCINISDTFEQLLDKFFDETHNFIEEARRNKCNVLVHCKAGISRSPAIAIAYLMKWKRLHLQDAYNLVKRCRPQISPNLSFMGQLVGYEKQLQEDRSHTNQ